MKLYDPADMRLPISFDPSERPEHPELQTLAFFFAYDRYFDEDTARKAIAAYYALTTFLDHCLGHVLRARGKRAGGRHARAVRVRPRRDVGRPWPLDQQGNVRSLGGRPDDHCRARCAFGKIGQNTDQPDRRRSDGAGRLRTGEWPSWHDPFAARARTGRSRPNGSERVP